MILKKIWTVLNTEMKWPDGTETVKGGVDAIKTVLELAKALNEKKTAQELVPLVGSISSLLDVLNSPLVQVAGTALPFIPIAAGILKYFLEQTHQEPTLQECVVLIGQAAYLKSLSEFLNSPDNQAIKNRLFNKPASEEVSKQIKALGKKLEGNEFELNEWEAKEALVCFHESKLAKEFNPVLAARFQDAGLAKREAEIVTERVSRSTHRYMKEAFAEAGESVKHLARVYGDGWQRDLEVYQSIDNYLQDIAQKPKEKVFEESFGFEDVYVPLQVKPVDKDSRVKDDAEAKNIEQWAVELLQDFDKKRQVLFIQGGPGRGKSVFCRMFAELVRRDLHPIWTPILIRLRDISAFDPTNFDETLEAAVGTRFTKEKDWLTDRNTRFLFLLDGFDELLLERGAKNELKNFLDQVGSFQSTCATVSDRGHRLLITGRPMALYGIGWMPSNLERVEIIPMQPEIQQQWFGKWEKQVGTDAAQRFQGFLNDDSCPKQAQTLAQEPLLLYLLAKMHREGHLRVEMFQQASPEGVKIKIYEETINWVLTKQRTDPTGDDLNEKIADPEVFRSILTEAGLCVVQSGGEHAAIAMIEERLGQKDEDAKTWLEEARKESQDDALKNALAAFYLKSAAEPDKQGDPKVEFYHKSFGEFLCAQRLQESLEEWTEKRGKRGKTYTVSTEKLNWEIYDLLGFGKLTPEIVEYLMALLKQGQVDWEVLFERLEGFYQDWCRGEFIEALDPAAENLPLKKVRQLQKYGIEEIGQRTVDIYAGLNVLILLLVLHRYAQTQDELKNKINFHPCGQPDTEEFDSHRLLQIMGYSQCLGANDYNSIVGGFLSQANLSQAVLIQAVLSGANLSQANLSGFGSDLRGAFLFHANLSGANLSQAKLSGAFLFNANLSQAKLSGANLSGADLTVLQWDNETQWGNARGLHEAVHVPSELAQHPPFQAAVSLSQGMDWVREGKVEDAIQAYEQAQTLDPNLQISAQSWNTLCWYGSLHAHASKVLFAGDKAVELEPSNKYCQDSRGLARGFTGDLAGAKEDFQAVLDSGYFDKREEEKRRRVRWVEVLEAGENPFTPEELQALHAAELWLE